MDPALLIRRDRAVGRAQQCRLPADRRHDGVLRSLQLVPDRFVRHFREVGMRPGMVRDLVSLAHGTAQDIGMVRGVLPDDKECRFEVMGGEEVEELRREGGVRTIVEGESDVRPFDVDRIKRDLRLGRRCRRYNRTSARNRRSRRSALPGSSLGKKNAEREINEQPSGKHGMAMKRMQKTFGVSSRGDLQRKPGRGPIFHG